MATIASDSPSPAEPSRAGDPPEDRREVRRWAMYGFSNHGWVTTVGTVLIGPWLLALATSAAGNAHNSLFSVGPIHLRASAYPSFAIAVAALLQVPVLPLLGASADRIGRKRRIITITCLVGSLCAALLATTGGSAWLYAGVLFVLGNAAFGASDVVYNSFLPRIAPPEHRDAVSSYGFAVGYLGSGLILALNLAVLQLHDSLGLTRADAVRVCFLMGAMWWAVIGVWAVRGLRERRIRAAARSRPRRLGLDDLADGLRTLRGMPNAFRYLIGYLFFADAISAVVGLASTYLTHELYHDDAAAAATFLFSLILLIQFLAIGGSLLFAQLARVIGTKPTVLVTLVLWCVVVVYAYLILHTKGQAVAMGVLIALVLGGSQALSRSLYSQMVPRGHEATFFGLFEISDRGTSWVAPLLFTIVVDATGSFRQAILSLIVLFVVGIVLLARTNVDAAKAEAVAASVD